MSKLISSKGKRANPSPKYGKITLAVVIALAVAILLLLNVFTYLLTVVNYYGDSMEPELHSGQTLVVARTQKVEEGDVIAFYYNNKVLVRRVICTGGNYIDIADDGRVSINDELIAEPYVQNPTPGQCDIELPYVVPYGKLFVMGDARDVSMDSRLQVIGCISPDRIIGKVIFAI